MRPQRTSAGNNTGKSRFTLTKTEDLVETTHVIKHLNIKCGGFPANPGTQAAHCEREQFRQHDTDHEMSHNQQDGEDRAQRKQCDGIDDGGRNGDYDRRNGVGEENLKQFHVCGDQRDQAALAFACELGGRKATQCRERLGAKQRKKAESHIMVNVQFGVA